MTPTHRFAGRLTNQCAILVVAASRKAHLATKSPASKSRFREPSNPYLRLRREYEDTG